VLLCCVVTYILYLLGVFIKVRDLIDRYKSKEQRMEQMKLLILDLDEEMEEITAKKEETAKELEELLESLDDNISTRQIHLENEKIEISMFLSMNRLRSLREDVIGMETSIKSLTAAVPRFITKLTKEPSPPCPEDEVNC
jgi:DNA repair exonuclease SbcCD ATPase subunit